MCLKLIAYYTQGLFLHFVLPCKARDVGETLEHCLNNNNPRNLYARQMFDRLIQDLFNRLVLESFLITTLFQQDMFYRSYYCILEF